MMSTNTTTTTVIHKCAVSPSQTIIKPLTIFEGHQGPVETVEVISRRSGGFVLITGCADHTVRVWCSGGACHGIGRFPSAVNAVILTHRRGVVTDHETRKQYDTRTSCLPSAQLVLAFAMNGVAYCFSLPPLCDGTGQGCVQKNTEVPEFPVQPLYSLQEVKVTRLQLLPAYQSHCAGIRRTCAVHLPNALVSLVVQYMGLVALVGGFNGGLELRELHTQTPLQRYTTTSDVLTEACPNVVSPTPTAFGQAMYGWGAVLGLDVSPDETHAIACHNEVVSCWPLAHDQDTTAGCSMKSDSWVIDCAFLSNEQVVTVCEDGTLGLWQLTPTVRCIGKYQFERHHVICMRVLSARYIVLGASKGVVQLWDLHNHRTEAVFQLDEVNHSVCWLTLSPLVGPHMHRAVDVATQEEQKQDDEEEVEKEEVKELTLFVCTDKGTVLAFPLLRPWLEAHSSIKPVK